MQELNPQAENRYKLAKAWELRGKIDRAIVGYQEAIKIQSNYVDAYISLGNLLLMTGKWNNVIELYSQALNFDSNIEQIYYYLREFKNSQCLREQATLDQILFYTDCFRPYGAGHWNHSILCALKEKGYSVICAQIKTANFLVKQRTQLGISHLWIQENNLDYLRTPVRAFYNLTETTNCFRQSQTKLTIFSDGGPFSNLTAKQVAIELGIPFIIVVHCVLSEWAKQFSHHLEQLEKIYQKAEAVIAVSQDNLKLLHEVFKLPANKGQVIYSGRPSEYFTETNLSVRHQLRQSLNIPDDALVCFTSARLDIEKGYQYQLSAIESLKQREIWSKLYFVWAGNGSLWNKIETTIEELGVQDRVKLLGERNDIPDLLDATDIFILPSQFEGMPFSIMEAMAKGKPVIATAVSGIPEELGDTGKLLPNPKIDPQKTIQELVMTLENWANNPTLLQQMGQKTQLRAMEMFQEKTMINNYLILIQSLIN